MLRLDRLVCQSARAERSAHSRPCNMLLPCAVGANSFATTPRSFRWLTESSIADYIREVATSSLASTSRKRTCRPLLSSITQQKMAVGPFASGLRLSKRSASISESIVRQLHGNLRRSSCHSASRIDTDAAFPALGRFRNRGHRHWTSENRCIDVDVLCKIAAHDPPTGGSR